MGERAPRAWRGQPHDVRVQSRRTQLIEAAVELLGTEGTAGVTMRAACRNAGLSLRYFYESFSDTDELILATYDHCNAELIALMTTAAGTASPIRAVLDGAAAYFEEDPRRLRILLREPQSSSLLADRRAEVLPGLMGALVSPPGIDDSSAATTARAMSASAVSGALTELILDWADGRLQVSRAELVTFAAGLLRTALSAANPSPS